MAYRCLIWPLLTVSTFPPSYLPVWLLPLGVAVDLVFLLRVSPYLRAAIGAISLTLLGYGLLRLSTVVTGTPTDLANMSIAEIRAAFESGSHLLTPPIAWWSIWIALPVSLLTWGFVTWLTGRTMGLNTPRPPEISVHFGTEPRRDPQGRLDGWPARQQDPAPVTPPASG